MDSQKENIQILYRAIDDLASKYRANPYNYLYEVELQAALFSNLYDLSIGQQVEIADGSQTTPTKIAIPHVNSIPFHCEYPSGERFDMALVEWVHGVAQPTEALPWNKNVRAAVEIKYYQLTDRDDSRVTGFQADIAKLRRYLENKNSGSSFLGLAIMFIQDEKLLRDSLKTKYQMSNSSRPTTGIHSMLITPKEILWELASA